MNNQPTEWHKTVKEFRRLNKCLYAKREGQHKVACGKDTVQLKPLPVCGDHQEKSIRIGWRNIIEGA